MTSDPNLRRDTDRLKLRVERLETDVHELHDLIGSLRCEIVAGQTRTRQVQQEVDDMRLVVRRLMSKAGLLQTSTANGMLAD